MDRLTPERRSRLMSQVRGKDTTPEMVVRRAAHRMGLRFRLHRKDLPGKPDLVFPKHRTAIFVHGCFWHRHANCKKATMPKSNVKFWREKFERNVQRDRRNQAELAKAGWQVGVIWECQTKDPEEVTAYLKDLFSRSADNSCEPKSRKQQYG